MKSLSKLKGSASTKFYSPKGLVNAENMNWEHKLGGKCIHRRPIGKRSICLVNSTITCPQNGSETISDCPANRYHPSKPDVHVKANLDC